MADRTIHLALKEDPDNIDVLTLAGQIAHDLDHYEDSIKYFEKALKARPNSIEALNYYGVALKSVGRLEDARNTFIKALEVQPRAIGTYSNLVDLEKFTADNPLFQAMQRHSHSMSKGQRCCRAGFPMWAWFRKPWAPPCNRN